MEVFDEIMAVRKIKAGLVTEKGWDARINSSIYQTQSRAIYVNYRGLLYSES